MSDEKEGYNCNHYDLILQQQKEITSYKQMIKEFRDRIDELGKLLESAYDELGKLRQNTISDSEIIELKKSIETKQKIIDQLMSDKYPDLVTTTNNNDKTKDIKQDAKDIIRKKKLQEQNTKKKEEYKKRQYIKKMYGSSFT